MFTTLALSVASPRDIRWMPVKLTLAVVSMSMKHTNHHAKVKRVH